MEVLDSVILKSSVYENTHMRKTCGSSKNSSFLNSSVCLRENRVPRLRKSVLKVGNYGIEDKGHLEYYSKVAPVCGEKKGKKGWSGVSTKKRMKLLKGLVNDLSMFSELSFGSELDCDKERTVSEAAETLLAHLKQLREEEQMKDKEKMKNCKSLACESSSSSSESSDSECDEVIDMKYMKKPTIVQPIETKESTTISTLPEKPMNEQQFQNSEQCCNMILEMTLNKDAGIEVLRSDTTNTNQLKVESIEKKIEVCMGGKCKKSGSPALMEEFQRVMDDEVVVAGCKCLGKCKSAPNVRVLNGNVVDDSLRTPSNAVCIGVGLEDVETIVANYFGEGCKDQLRVAVAGALS